MHHLPSFQTMESKLLVGGKNIIDHTNEQQKMLELKRQEIAEQVKKHPHRDSSQFCSVCVSSMSVSYVCEC